MPDAAPLHDVAALVPGAVARDPFGIGVHRGDRVRAAVVAVPAVVFVPRVSPRVRLQGDALCFMTYDCVWRFVVIISFPVGLKILF